MVIIGHKQDEVFLLDIGNGQGQILDLTRGLLFPPTPMSSLTSQAAPWYDYTGPQERLEELLAKVSPAPPLPPRAPRATEEEVRLRIERLRAERKP